MMLKIGHRVLKILLHTFYRFRIAGRQNIPPGGAILCCNHTAYFDPLFVICVCKEFPYTMGKVELFNKKWKAAFFRWVRVFPVHRETADLRAIKTALDLLRAGNRLQIFPEGTRFKTEENKRGVAMLALKTGVPIVPVFITEGKKRLFRRIDVVIGAPYHPEIEGKKPGPDDYARVADQSMARVYALRPNRG